VYAHVLVPPLPTEDLRGAMNGLVDDGLAVEEPASIVGAVGVNVVRINCREAAHIRESQSLLVVKSVTLFMGANVCT